MSVTMHAAGKAHAKSLIAAGKVDETSDWTFDAEEEDKLLGEPNDWTAYSKWFMGEDTAATKDTKGQWKYPFGKDGKLYRSALRAIASRASAEGVMSISEAASELLKELDGKTASNVAQLRPTEKRRVIAAAADRSWYRIVAAADPAKPDDPAECADIYLFDELGQNWWTGDGVTAKQFIADLKALPDSVKAIRLHINSPGGDVFEATAIANALRQHPAMKTVMIEGLCASAATIVSCAGDAIQIADNALMMIHNPYTMVYGDAAELRSLAAVMDQVKQAIVATYRWISPMSAKDLGSLMDAQTWMSADEAIANGFATEKVIGMKAAALLARGALDRLAVPERLRPLAEALVQHDETAQPEEVLRLCREGGCPEIGEGLIAVKASVVAAKAEIARVKSVKDAAAARARDIAALCATAKVPELAKTLTASAMSVEDVRTHLTIVAAKLGGGEIDASLNPDGSHRETAGPRISARNIYAERNKQHFATKEH